MSYQSKEEVLDDEVEISVKDFLELMFLVEDILAAYDVELDEEEIKLIDTLSFHKKCIEEELEKFDREEREEREEREDEGDRT